MKLGWSYLRITMAILGASMLLASETLSMLPIGTSGDWQLWGLGLFMSGVILQMIISQHDMDKRSLQRPKITTGKPPTINQIPIVDKDGLVKGKPFFVFVYLTNKPVQNSSRATATNVFSHLEFYDPDGKLLLGSVYGRWNHSRQPASMDIFDAPAMQEILRTDIHVGEEVSIAIALKFLEDSSFYAFNNDSIAHVHWARPAFELKGNVVYVKLTLEGEFEDLPEFWFRLENGGSGEKISPSQVTNPFKGQRKVKRKPKE